MIIENTRKVIREACELLENQKTAVERATRRTLGELHDALLAAETQVAALDVNVCKELLKINKLPDLLKRTLEEAVNRCENFQKQIAAHQEKVKAEQAAAANPAPTPVAPPVVPPASAVPAPSAAPSLPPVTSAAALAQSVTPAPVPESPQAVS